MIILGVVLALILFFVVLGWWADGVLAGSEAATLVAVFGALAIGFFAAEHTWQRIVAFVPLAGGGAYVVYSIKMGGVREYYKRKLDQYMRAIEFDPGNLAARQFLADTLYGRGKLDQAIDELRVAVDMGSGFESEYKLKKWERERYLRDTPNAICRWCGTEHPPKTRSCEKCGAELPYHGPFTRWLSGGRTDRARYYLILVAGVALIWVSLAVLPLQFAFIPLGLCILALWGWSLLSSARW